MHKNIFVLIFVFALANAAAIQVTHRQQYSNPKYARIERSNSLTSICPTERRVGPVFSLTEMILDFYKLLSDIYRSFT